jgi:ubiquinone/menaquinone biosynthesis C-methylase UbiE
MFRKMKRKLKRTIRKGRVLGSKVKRALLGRAPMDYSGLLSVEPIKHDESSFERDQRVYREHSSELLNTSQKSDAYAVAIGSVDAEAFIYFGKMEADLLYQYGLSDESVLVDVGCGSGRLALALASRFSGSYLGTDISPELIAHARGIAQSKNFNFVETIGLTVPVANNSVDFACFFSVLTHLRHEESYLFLEDTVRSLKSGGKIIFSFIDFSQSSHWAQFEPFLNALRDGKPSPVNQMMSHDTIYRFAEYLQVEVIAIHDGSTNYIVNTEPKISGHEEPLVSLGQSVCVLRKR